MFVLPNQVYEHRKTGGLYEVLCLANLEADLTPVVVYADKRSNKTWVRPLSEFKDGRFKRVR